MSENEMVRELLWKAAGTVPVPESRGSESVFARAARLRLRRRAGVTGVAAAGVAAAVVLGSGALSGGQGQSPAASPAAELTGFGKLLPAGVGKVRQVSLGQLLKGTKKPLGGKKVGPYDGDYAVSRDGGTGFVTVYTATHVKNPEADPCGMPHETPRKEQCTRETVSGGAVLTIWHWPAQKAVQPAYSGPELHATLLLRNGTLLSVRDWTGFTGQGALGPVMKNYPLTRAQLRELVLKSDLLP
ncbi:hypothetical protein ACFV2H_45610 [Streptomyces sp. NPDC059629]|uniref:hypothetical protein n=1 Tax=Streptomyces sp. NPDC059629 TaxID=3346889 RepID=UPI0036BE3C9F